jgi:acetyl esterase/lipase
VTLPARIDRDSRQPLEAVLQEMPGGINSIPSLARRREIAHSLDQRRRLAPSPRLLIENRTITAAAGHSISVRIYRPQGHGDVSPVLFLIHGGGMVMGSLDGSDPIAARFTEELGAVVVSVDYRLAPEHPYPAAVDDCVEALRWTVDHAPSLGADPQRLLMFGGSAGGGLALATALRSRDEDGPRPLLVMAPYPMIDPTGESGSTLRLPDLGTWDRAHNAEAWRWYLGGQTPDGYAAPALATDLAGLPPTFIDVGTEDIFLDESIDFAQRLAAAGVPTELHVYPGAYHASEDLAPEAPLSRTIQATRTAALCRALDQYQENV